MINEVKWHTNKIEHWKNNNIKYNTNNNDNKNNDTNKKNNNNNNNNNNNYDNLFDQHIWALSFRDRHGYRLFDTSYPYKYSNLYPFCNPFKYSTLYLFSYRSITIPLVFIYPRKIFIFGFITVWKQPAS